MRFVIAGALALALAACDAPTSTSDTVDSSSGGYTLEIRANSNDEAYLITAPDGRTAGARVVGEVSALMDADRVQSLLAEAPPVADEDGQDAVSIRVGTFALNIGGANEDENGDNGQVHISVDSGEGQQVVVNADEGAAGDADDRAFVRITGADEEAVRKFVADAEGLSPEVRTQLLAGVGLQ